MVNFNLRRDHQKISYERRAYESVDEMSLYLAVSRKTTGKKNLGGLKVKIETYRHMIFIIALVFTFVIKLRFPKEVSIATILNGVFVYTRLSCSHNSCVEPIDTFSKDLKQIFSQEKWNPEISLTIIFVS